MLFNDGETYFPIEIEAMLSQSNLKNSAGTTLESYPLSENNLIDHNHADNYMDQASKDQSDHDNVIYSNVFTAIDGKIVIQYWFFYLYDTTADGHEGDWEMIQLVLPNKDSSPTDVGYSFHYQGDKGTWTQASASTGHPQVYVAKGGHGSFWWAGLGGGGVGTWDKHYGDGLVWEVSTTQNLIRIVDNDLWLKFDGYWGADWGHWIGPSVRGPLHRLGNDRYMWSDALYWMEGLD
jgi:hypothetical protein